MLIYKVRIFGENAEEFDDKDEALERARECLEDMEHGAIEGFSFWRTGTRTAT